MTKKELKKMTVEEFANRLQDDYFLKNEVVQNMLTYGGSFVKCLAPCLITADHINLHKLAVTFYEYLSDYATFREDD